MSNEYKDWNDENSKEGYYYQGNVEHLIEILREYLNYDSTDGKKIRMVLRQKLKEMIKE